VVRCGRHAVEAIPRENGPPAVAHALGHVAAFVVAVAGARVAFQQVVGWMPERVAGRQSVDDVACGIEGEHFASDAAIGFEQTAHQITLGSI
jgi:hypothetical protein